MITDLYNETLQSLNQDDIVEGKFYELISDAMEENLFTSRYTKVKIALAFIQGAKFNAEVLNERELFFKYQLLEDFCRAWMNDVRFNIEP